jgi:putative ATP-binding cassette transporter
VSRSSAPIEPPTLRGSSKRIACARLFLHNPDIIVLNEATSAQDDELMTKELPKATVTSVAHRAEPEAFHSRKIVLQRRKGGAELASDIDLSPRKGKRRLLGRFLRHRKAAPKKAA